MLSPVNSSPPVVNPYGAECCPECGYSRTGLPSKGHCPECGAEFWADEIVLYGWGTGSLASVANANAGRVSVLLLWSIITVSFWVALAKIWSPLFYAMAILCGGVSVIALARRWRTAEQLAAPLQLRMSAKGYSISQGLGPAIWRLWYLSDAVAFEQRTGHRHWVRIERSRDMHNPGAFRAVDMEVDIDPANVPEITQRVREFQYGGPGMFG